MEKQIKPFQLSMLLIAIIPITKLIFLPSISASLVQNDSWLLMLLMLALDFVVFITIYRFAKKYPDISFFQLIFDTLGKTPAICICMLYGLFFMLRTITPFLELMQLLSSNLYERAPKITMMLPIIAVCIYAATIGLRSVGRVSNIVGYFSIISIIIIILIAFTDADFSQLLPVAMRKPSDFAISIPKIAIWFGDCSIMLIFCGKIKFDQKSRSPIYAFIISTVFVILFILLFTAAYGELAFRQINAITKISAYNANLTKMGRFDWIPIIFLLCAMLLAVIISFSGSVEMFSTCFYKHAATTKKYVTAALSVIIFAVVYIASDTPQIFYPIIMGAIGWSSIAVQYVLILLLPILYKMRDKRCEKNEKIQASKQID